MNALTIPFWAQFFTAPRILERTDPPAPRLSQTVFIHDATTPYRGETLLSVMIKRDMARLDMLSDVDGVQPLQITSCNTTDPDRDNR